MRPASTRVRNCSAIDGINLRSAELQTLLCSVAAAPDVRLVASIDDVHTPNMWSKEMVERFQWRWIHCDTYAPYRTEVSRTVSSSSRTATTHTALMAGPATDAYERALKVLASLPQHARAAFRALCVHMQKQGTPQSAFTATDWSRIEACTNIPVRRYSLRSRVATSQFSTHPA